MLQTPQFTVEAIYSHGSLAGLREESVCDDFGNDVVAGAGGC